MTAPLTYISVPATGPVTCACGCGGPVPGHRVFLPGHDQKALHDRVAAQWGSTLAFVRWFDATYPGARRGRRRPPVASSRSGG